jgi:Restriction endonuclease AspBHI N-terminal
MGGFRIAGKQKDKLFVALFTTGEDKDWPDRIDLATGQFVYYGDNKTPGYELHNTHKGGNLVLKRVFDLLHGSPPNRKLIPPFFIFQKCITQKSARAVQFKGLAVPGHPSLSATADLAAVWKTTANQRFQNYRSGKQGHRGQPSGQPFTYDLFGSLNLSEFERRGPWFAESSGPPNCCWAYGIAPQFRRDSIQRDPSKA